MLNQFQPLESIIFLKQIVQPTAAVTNAKWSHQPAGKLSMVSIPLQKFYFYFLESSFIWILIDKSSKTIIKIFASQGFWFVQVPTINYPPDATLYRTCQREINYPTVARPIDGGDRPHKLCRSVGCPLLGKAAPPVTLIGSNADVNRTRVFRRNFFFSWYT